MHLNRLRMKIKEADARDGQPVDTQLTPRFYSNAVNKEEQEARQKAMEQSAMTSMPLPAVSPAVPEAKPVAPSTSEVKKETEMTITVRKKEAGEKLKEKVKGNRKPGDKLRARVIRTKCAQEEERDPVAPYSATLSQIPLYMLGGGTLGLGVGELSGAKAQVPIAEQIGKASKTQELLEPVAGLWQQQTGGRPLKKVLQEAKSNQAPAHVLDALKEMYGKVQSYESARKNLPKLKDQLRGAVRRGRMAGVGGGLGAGLLAAMAMGAFNKESSDRTVYGYDDALFTFLDTH